MFPIPQFVDVDRSKLHAAFPQIESIFRDFMEKQYIPGVAYGVVVDGELIYSGGLGVENVASQRPVTPDSVFRIASMTKSFTTMALVKLRDEGKFQLDDLVEKHVPELAALNYPTRDSARITVRQLMTMSAGFPQDDPWADRQLAIEEEQLSAWMQKGLTFSNPPGVKYEYSNYGFAILGRIVTNVSGVPYQQYVTENILKPLGMTSTTYDTHTVDAKRFAMGYRRQDNQWVEEPPLADGAFASIGGLFTTVNDFAKYMTFLLSAFPPRDEVDKGPVQRSSLREMQQPWRQRIVASSRVTPDAPTVSQSDGYGYGLACGIDSVLGYSVSHGGGLPGYGTFYRLLPDCNAGIVVLTNLTYCSPAPRIDEAYVALRKTGGLPARRLPVSQVLSDVQKGITDLYNMWNDADMTKMATDSFFQDLALERRRQQVQELRASLGKCKSVSGLEAENNLRGRWWMQCAKGRIEVFVTLSPTVPPKVQHLLLTPAHNLSAELNRIVKQVVGLINEWDKNDASKLFAPSLKPKVMHKQFAALTVHYGGKLRIADVIGGNGETEACIRLVGAHGEVNMRITLDSKSKRVTGLFFTRPRETTFVP